MPKSYWWIFNMNLKEAIFKANEIAAYRRHTVEGHEAEQIAAWLNELQALKAHDGMTCMTPAFNLDYFKIGEAVKVSYKEEMFWTGLILEVRKDVISIIRVKHNPQLSASSKFESSQSHVYINDVNNWMVNKLNKENELG